MLSPSKEWEGLLNAGTEQGRGSDLAGAPRPVAAAAHKLLRTQQPQGCLG